MPQYDDRLMAVMSPLLIKDDAEFGQFEQHLEQARDIGVEAISVDVWWGIAQPTRTTTNFDYYDRVFRAIEERGLGIVPIMSFHRCGGGPGDDVNIDLPGWLAEFVQGQGGSSGDLRYQSETGNESPDAIPPWLGEEVGAVYQQMAGFLGEFLKQFRPLLVDGRFPEINVSLGPTGELRYPSYNAADGWRYPHRGFYQCYSESARRSFLRWVRAPEHGCAWASQYADPEIRVPNGHLPGGQGARADGFVAEKLHLVPGYGQDFTQWYHQSLIGHGRRLLAAAIAMLKIHCATGVRAAPMLGMKIPGVHWQWRCTGVPRYAELTAGLIPPQCCFVPDDASATGYEDAFDMVGQLSSQSGWPIRAHFTALEMDDDTVPDSWPNDQEKTSMAHSLVRAVGRTAANAGVPLSGENALANVDAPDSPTNVASWDYIRKSFDLGYFSGLTLLRLCRGGWDTDREGLRQFIRDYDRDGRGLLRRGSPASGTRPGRRQGQTGETGAVQLERS